MALLLEETPKARPQCHGAEKEKPTDVSDGTKRAVLPRRWGLGKKKGILPPTGKQPKYEASP